MLDGIRLFCRRGAPHVCLILCLMWAGSAAAQNSSEATSEAVPKLGEQSGRTGLPLPRFVSFRAPKVNLRTGPGTRYPIDWVYTRQELPVEIIDEFDNWRRIRDWQGTVGWVHQSMLQARRSALVTGERRLLRAEPLGEAAGIAWLEVGVIARLERCDETWCQVEVGKFTGWLRRDEFYGAYADENLP